MFPCFPPCNMKMSNCNNWKCASVVRETHGEAIVQLLVLVFISQNFHETHAGQYTLRSKFDDECSPILCKSHLIIYWTEVDAHQIMDVFCLKKPLSPLSSASNGRLDFDSFCFRFLKQALQKRHQAAGKTLVYKLQPNSAYVSSFVSKPIGWLLLQIKLILFEFFPDSSWTAKRLILALFSS